MAVPWDSQHSPVGRRRRAAAAGMTDTDDAGLLDIRRKPAVYCCTPRTTHDLRIHISYHRFYSDIMLTEPVTPLQPRWSTPQTPSTRAPNITSFWARLGHSSSPSEHLRLHTPSILDVLSRQEGVLLPSVAYLRDFFTQSLTEVGGEVSGTRRRRSYTLHGMRFASLRGLSCPETGYKVLSCAMEGKCGIK